MDNFLTANFAMRNGSGGHGSDPILELENVLHDKLQVKDESSETSSDSPSDGSSGLEDENKSNYNLNMEGPSAMANKISRKCVTFPVLSFSEGNQPESPPKDCNVCSRSSSMPTTRKLVSAMKGSREKEGVPQKKLSVSWAPDVYDPPPSSVSHYPKKKNCHQYSKSHKKHGKGKHKGKNVRGGGSGPKEKKHCRNTGGRSDLSVDSYADTERLRNYKSSRELLDLNDPGMGSSDPNCGNNFLGQAGGSMHYVY